MKKFYVFVNLVIASFMIADGSLAQTITYLSAPPNVAHPLDLTKVVGSLPGEAGVNSLGAAIYSIPIELPPGTAGVTPQLSLQYNSMAGNGIMGIGWNIGGISCISRAGKNLYNENDYSLVNYSATDKLCLDGQRLILKSGTWFGTGSSYSTQHESYSQITFNGTYFIMLTPNGDSIYYGNTTESRFKLDATKVLNWYISKIADAFGNTIYYTYKQIAGNNELLIDKIEYTKTKTFSAYNKIQFNYESGRSDYLRLYHSGILFNGDYILKGITVYSNGVLQKELLFRYFKNSNFDSYLAYIEQKGKDGLMTNTTQFNWTQGRIKNLSEDWVSHHSGIILKDATAGDYINAVKYSVGTVSTVLDADGDGKSDLLTYNFINNNLELKYNELDDICTKVVPNDYKGIIPIDYDGDGQEEILLHKGGTTYDIGSYSSSSGLLCYGVDSLDPGSFDLQILKFSNGVLTKVNTTSNYGVNNLQNIMYSFIPGDFDGNGRTDLFFYSDNGTTTSYILFLAESISESNLFPNRIVGTFDRSGSFFSADFDGDGKDDLLNKCDTSISINRIGRNVSSYIYTFGTWKTITSRDLNVSKLSFGDFNGDGRVDILEADKRINHSLISAYSSKGLNDLTDLDDDLLIALDSYLGPDINGDNKSDFIRVDKVLPTSGYDYNFVLNGTFVSGGGAFRQNITTGNYGNINQELFGDFNGDGIMEIALDYSEMIPTDEEDEFEAVQTIKISSIITDRAAMQIGSILNGINKKTSITYWNTSSASTYTSTDPPIYSPYVRTINPKFRVVRNMEIDNGLDDHSIIGWDYENAHTQIYGRGFIGFGKITVTNYTTGIKSESVYTFEPNTYEPLLKSTLVSTNGTTSKRLSGTNYAYKYYSWGTGGQKHYLIYPDTAASYDYLSMFKQKTTYTFTTADLSHGNWSSAVKKYYTIGSALQENASITTTNTFETFFGSKFYRLKTTATNTTRPSQTASKTKKSLVYLNANCTRLNKEIIYYYNPVSGVEDSDKDTITYNYTTKGNVNQVISQLGNIKRTMGYQLDTKERFNTTTTDPLGYITTAQYDDRGLLLSTTDPNSISLSQTYDGLGRLLAVNNPDASDRTDSIKWVKTGDMVAPQYAVYYHKVMVTGKPYVKTYYDKLGRALRAVTIAQNNKQIYTDAVYDSLGRQFIASLPYFPGETIHWNYTTYYDDGRVHTTYVDSNVKKTTFTYDKNKVTQTMNNTGQVYTKTYDATGALINATDPGGSISYTYYSSGNLKSSAAPGSTLTCEYDKYNRQKKLIDPNAGTTEYENNAYGEVVYQKDALGNWFRYTKLDKAGRPLTKTSSDGSTVTFTYDTDFKGALYNIAHSNGISSQYLHDALGRVIKQKETIQGTLYETSMTYNAYSNVERITYPSTLNIQYTYTANGYLSHVKHTNNTVTMWTAGDINALGQWKNFTLGTAINRTFTYNAYGMPDEIKVNTLQNDKYTFDVETGNLTGRTNGSLAETFTYNSLDQLTSWKANGTTYTVGYKTDGTSRINTKTDGGTFVYGAAPAIHRVTGITGNPGTFPNDVAAEYKYTAFNKVDSIYESTRYKQRFIYGADEQRRVSRLYNSSNTKVLETVYVPGGYEVEKRGTVTRKMHYIPLGDCWALYVKNSSGADSLYYLLTDHLGSVTVITNANGAMLTAPNSYDPWGRRRNFSDGSYQNMSPVIVTNRGFTMHEHMDNFKLINMNGRVYDPVLGQFLSPDPFIGNASSTMSYNRYAYCNYNPLKYTDPSGYWSQRPKPEVIPPLEYYVPEHIRPGGMRISSSITALDNAFNATHTWIAGFNGKGMWVSNNDPINVYSNGTWNENGLRQALLNKGVSGFFDVVDYTSGNAYTRLVVQMGDLWLASATNSVESYSYMVVTLKGSSSGMLAYWSNGPSIGGASGQGGGDTPEWIKNTGRGVGAYMPANITKEVLIDYARTTGNIGKTGVKYLRVVRGTGVAGSLVGISVSGYNIVHDYNKNGNGFADVNGWDVADAGIGTAGLAVSGFVVLGLVSNPIGWGVAIGTGAYFLGRLIYDVATDE